MYCRYTETSIWDHEQCPLNGGEFYCARFHCCIYNCAFCVSCLVKTNRKRYNLLIQDVISRL